MNLYLPCTSYQTLFQTFSHHRQNTDRELLVEKVSAAVDSSSIITLEHSISYTPHYEANFWLYNIWNDLSCNIKMANSQTVSLLMHVTSASGVSCLNTLVTLNGYILMDTWIHKNRDQTKPPDKYLTRVQLPVVDKNCWWRVICNDSLLNSSVDVWSISEWVCWWPLVLVTPVNGWLTVESSLTVSSVVLVPDGTEGLLIPFSCQSYSLLQHFSISLPSSLP